jgi:hypothetical protein
MQPATLPKALHRGQQPEPNADARSSTGARAATAP